LLELKKYINMVVPQEDSLWNSLSLVASLLTPFQIATEVVQSDSATLYDVYNQFVSLATHIGSMDEEHPFCSIKADALKAIKHHWNKNINKSAVITCAALSFDNSHKALFSGKDISEALKWFLKFGVSYVKYYGMSESDNEQDIETILMTQWSDFLSCSGIFTEIEEYKERFYPKQASEHSGNNNAGSNNTAADNSTSGKNNTTSSVGGGKKYVRWDARVLWKLYLNSAHELSSCALALLSVTASEAAVERSFSMQDIVHSKRRNRLLDASVQDEMFIKFNHRALDQKPDITGSVVELTEDFESADLTSIFNSDVTADGPSNPLESTVASMLNDTVEDSETKEPVQSIEATEEVIQRDTIAKKKMDTTEFIVHYIRENHITAAYKWNADKTNHLENNAVQNHITVATGVLKKKIMSRVSGGEDG